MRGTRGSARASDWGSCTGCRTAPAAARWAWRPSAAGTRRSALRACKRLTLRRCPPRPGPRRSGRRRACRPAMRLSRAQSRRRSSSPARGNQGGRARVALVYVEPGVVGVGTDKLLVGMEEDAGAIRGRADVFGRVRARASCRSLRNEVRRPGEPLVDVAGAAVAIGSHERLGRLEEHASALLGDCGERRVVRAVAPGRHPGRAAVRPLVGIEAEQDEQGGLGGVRA